MDWLPVAVVLLVPCVELLSEVLELEDDASA